MMRPRRPRQMPLVFRTWGGSRAGAGRKPNAERAGVHHIRRPDLDGRHPVHVTVRVGRTVPNLRSQRCMSALRRAFVAAKARQGLRLVHFSVQANHIHFLVEADDKRSLARGVQSLAIRVARGLNKELGRHGRVFADRYHARALKTPREVKNGLAYVLLNHRHHAREHGWSTRELTLVDACSSAPTFDGWSRAVSAPGGSRASPESPTVEPRTWLLAKGWRRFGLIDPFGVPGKL
jgi:REP element-mobilizing transposase RayT